MIVAEHYVEAIAHNLGLDVEHVREVRASITLAIVTST